MEVLIHGNGHKLLPAVDLKVEIERLQEELADERNRNLRSLANFENVRRRIERDGNMIAEESKRELMLLLLDIIDDLEKVLRCASDEERPSIKGGEIIHRKFLTLLKTHGVLPFDSIGRVFNHELHEPVDIVRHEGCEAGTVVAELCRGYLWNNELLRPAQVLVAGW